MTSAIMFLMAAFVFANKLAFLLAKLHTGVFCMTQKRKVDPALEGANPLYSLTGVTALT